jgi:hypothetical protein
MARPWKLLSGSAVGASHQRSQEPCQDYALGRVVQTGADAVLVVACADGAGSSRYAELGARLACLGMVRAITAAIEEGLRVAEIDPHRLLHWHRQTRGALATEACLRNLDIREFACTLLTAIVGQQHAAFSQIGDGAIVAWRDKVYQTVFWPQTGEYANTTFFLTNPDYEDRLELQVLEECVEELALFTDGLQMLALHYQTRTVHAPFFEPMFRALRQTADAEPLEEPLRRFLASKPVSDRSDDDKTLILATRRPCHDDREQALR